MGTKRRDAVSQPKRHRPAKKMKGASETLEEAIAFAATPFGQAVGIPAPSEKDAESAAILLEQATKVELFLDVAARDDAKLKDALKDAGLDGTTDVMHDARHYDPSAQTKEQKNAALVLVESELNRVADLDRKCKDNGASLADRQKLWESVPMRLRPDDVVEDLRAYALTQRLIADESDESKQASWDMMVQNLIKTGGSVVGTLLSSAGITATTIDFAGAAGTMTGNGVAEDGSRTTGNYGEDFEEDSIEGYRVRMWGIAQAFQFIADAVVAIDKSAKEPPPGQDEAAQKTEAEIEEEEKSLTPEEKKAAQEKRFAAEVTRQKKYGDIISKRKQAMDARVGDTLAKLMTVTAALKVLIGHIKILPVKLPQLSGILTACEGFLTLAEAYEMNLKAGFMSDEVAAILVHQSETSRTDDVGMAINAIADAAGDKLAQTLKAKNAAMAAGVGKISRGTGTVGMASGDAAVSPVLFIGGMIAEFGSAIYGLKNAKDDLFKSFDDDERHLTLLRQAALGDADAKKEIMSDCPFYCAMYLGHAVKEGNEDAINLLNTMNFADAEDFKNYDEYMIRKAMLWAIGKDDLAPGSESPAAAALNSVTAKVTAAKDAIENAATWARDSGKRDKEIDLGVPELTANSWSTYKTRSTDSGVKSVSTGVKEQLAVYEASQPKIYKEGVLNVQQADACLSALEDVSTLISNYVPEWKSQPEGGYAPESAIEFCVRMRDLAEKARNELLADLYDREKHPSNQPPAPYAYGSDFTEAGFLSQVAEAKDNGVKVQNYAELAALISGWATSEKAFETGTQDAVHADGMVKLYIKTLKSIHKVVPENEHFPGLNQDFSNYLEKIGAESLSRIARYQGFVHRRNAEFKVTGPVDATPANFDANLKQAHVTLLEQNPKAENEIRARLAAIGSFYSDPMEGETASGPEVKEYLDSSEKAWVELSKSFGQYRRVCQSHKPWRLYIEDLMAIADAKAKSYGKRKVTIGGET